MHNLHGNFTFFLDSFLPPSTSLFGLFALPFPSRFFFLPHPFFFSLDCWFPLGLEVWTEFINVGWNGIGVDDDACIVEVICKDNCYNWFNRLAVLALIDSTNQSAWGPSLGLAISNLDLRASDNFFWRTPHWEYISSNCWTLKIACSLVNTLESDTSLDISGFKYLRSHSRRNSCGISALMSLFLLLHSWI